MLTLGGFIAAIMVTIFITANKAYEEGYRVGRNHGLKENFEDRRRKEP